jgi:arylsulfatase A-like enzyme
LPSHASVFTGLMPSRHGAASVLTPLPLRFDTLAERFQAAGWGTHAILYKPALADVGIDQGFDTFFNIPRVVVRADDNLRKALEWLDENADRRFFLFLHFDDPHQPYSQPKEVLSERLKGRLTRFEARLPLKVSSRYAKNLDAGAPELRDFKAGDGLRESFKALSRQLYDSEVEYVDARIGRFLEALRRRGLYEDTVIVFFSDHGEAHWEHDEYFGHGSRNFYEEVVRVPLIIKPAKRHPFRRGLRVQSQVRLFDLMPTVLEMAGLEVSGPPIQAQSLTPLMGHPGKTGTDRLAVTGSRRGLAVRFQGWKYMLRPQIARTGEVLFQLGDDRSESRDVHREYPEITRALRFAGLENRLRSRGGRYAVVVGDTGLRRYVVEMRMASSSPPPEVLYGLSQTGEVSKPDTTTYRFAGDWQRPLVLVAWTPGDAASRISVRGQPVAKESGVLTLEMQSATALFRPGESRFLQRLVDRGVPGIYLLDLGGSDSASLRSPASVADGRRLEALRALGYLD